MARVSVFRHIRSSIDSWSVPHFFFGTLMGLFSLTLAIPVWPALFLTLLFALLWEGFEFVLRIRETRWNVTSDILLPLVAFFVTYSLLDSVTISVKQHTALLVAASVFFVIANHSAWRARFERDPDFAN